MTASATASAVMPALSRARWSVSVRGCDWSSWTDGVGLGGVDDSKRIEERGEVGLAVRVNRRSDKGRSIFAEAEGRGCVQVLRCWKLEVKLLRSMTGLSGILACEGLN